MRRYDGCLFRLRLKEFSVRKLLNVFGAEPETQTRTILIAGEPPVVDHQSAVLNDFDACLGEYLCGFVVANAGLKPDGHRAFGYDVVDVGSDVVGPAKDIDHVDAAWNVGQFAINFLTQDHRRFGVIDRHRNNFETSALHVLRHVNGRLIGLGIGFDAEDGDPVGASNEIADLFSRGQKIFLPAHGVSLTKLICPVEVERGQQFTTTKCSLAYARQQYENAGMPLHTFFPPIVMPANAGIHLVAVATPRLDTGVRRYDGVVVPIRPRTVAVNRNVAVSRLTGCSAFK